MLIDSIQFLLYKENPSLLEKIDFDNDVIFLEPLLFAYFNSKKDNLFTTTLLTEIMQGYFVEKEALLIEESYNKESIAYLPNLGYFDKNKEKADEIYVIKNTSIELLLHPIVHLKYIFKDFNEKTINENEIYISKDFSLQYANCLTNAFSYIKKSCPRHFNLIEQHCKKIVLFKTDTKSTNSFATINAQGIAFLNIYQDDYDEVFFVDDIAHQTGHVIMNAILFERKKYFVIDENQNIGLFTKKKSEYRSFYVLYHALYTYYTTLLCLDNCLENNLFNKRQIHETYGRIGFYLMKYSMDLSNFEKVINYHNSIDNVLTSEGKVIFKEIVNQYIKMQEKYKAIVSKFNYKNQPYNFTYSEFVKLNPLPNE